MQFVKNFIRDVVLWTLLAICILNLPYANYAENIVSFYGIFLLILGVFCILTFDKITVSFADKKDFKPRGKIHNAYRSITTFIEITVVAALGWWWVTAGFIMFSLIMCAVRSKANELYEAKHATV